VLESGAIESGKTDAGGPPTQVVVFNDGERSVGMIVDQILDVAEEAVTVRQRSGRKGLLGSGVVGKRVTDFVDLNYVLHAASGEWSQGAGRAGGGKNTSAKNILVAESSAFSRGLIRSGLDMEGYRVIEAANLEEVLRGLEKNPVDVVVTAMDLPPNGSTDLLEAIRRRPEWRHIPILALADSPGQLQGQSADFQDYRVKFDRDGMLESVARLASALALAEYGAAEPSGVGRSESRNG
jgi:two-component system chemotaxis sensor kinase CheA